MRAAALEAVHVHERSDRIHCPMLDAARTGVTYGTPALLTCDQKGLDKFAAGIDLDASKVAAIAYMSGPFYKLISNRWNQQFDDSEVNTGFIKYLKNGVHTGILASGKFDQDVLNQFVWNLFPEWKDTTPIDKAFVESSKADDVYITSEHLDQIVAFNESQSDAAWKGLGPKLSQFEMEKLLLGKLGQAITLGDDESSSPKVRAMSLRDLHDFFKFGVYPVHIEDSLLKEGLIEDWSLAMSGQNSKLGAVKEDRVPEAK